MTRPRTFCEIDECGAPVVGRHMCRKHWQRWRKWGDPRVVSSRWKQTDAERFWSHVDRSGDCWAWTGGTKNGYGTFYVTRDGTDRMQQAHRFAFELERGPIPDGMTLDHLCHTAVADDCREGSKCPHRRCVRPDHLDSMPLGDNISAGGNGAKMTCKHGHEFTPENTGHHGPDGRYRYCLTCKRATNARAQARRTATARASRAQ